DGQVFATRLNPDTGGTVTLAYSTLLGGTDFDAGEAIAVDSVSEAWNTRETDSTDFPTADPLAIQSSANTDGNVFVAKIGPDLGADAALPFSSPFGGATGEVMNGAFDNGEGIDVSPGGSVFVAGESDTTD